MKYLTIFTAFSLLLLSSCSKTTPLIEQIQGVWTRNCGCVGDEYWFKGDTIFISQNWTNWINTGYVKNDSAYIACLVCFQPALVYYKFPIRMTTDGQRMYMGTGNDYICPDTTCADISYKRVK